MSLTVTAGNPIKVTGDTAASAEIVPNLTFVRFVLWYKPTTIGHLLSLTDSDGKALAAGYCDTANVSQYLPVYATFDGIYSDDMDSGALYIYIK